MVVGYVHTMYVQETWFVKTDVNGYPELNKTIASGVIGYPLSIVQKDDGYVILGSASGRGGSGGTVTVTKIDSEGNLQWWQQNGENDANPYATSSVTTSDGCYVLVGYVNAGRNGWIIKTDALGNMMWNMTYSYAQ